MNGKAATLLPGLLAAVAGCSNPAAPPEQQPPYIPISEIQAAPETLLVSDLPVSVRVHLSRDFAPRMSYGLRELTFDALGIDGGPLGAGIQLRVPGDSEFPARVGEVYMWVINGNLVWSKVMLRVSYISSPADQVNLVSGLPGGPRWGPGLLVDVAIGVRDVQGQLSLSIIRSVPITRVE